MLIITILKNEKLDAFWSELACPQLMRRGWIWIYIGLPPTLGSILYQTLTLRLPAQMKPVDAPLPRPANYVTLNILSQHVYLFT